MATQNKIIYSPEEVENLIQLLCSGQAENVQLAKQLLKGSIAPLGAILKQYAPFLIRNGLVQPNEFLKKAQKSRTLLFSYMPEIKDIYKYKGVQYLPVVEVSAYGLHRSCTRKNALFAVAWLHFLHEMQTRGWLPKLQYVFLYKSQYKAWEPLPRLANVQLIVEADYKEVAGTTMKVAAVLKDEDWEAAQVGDGENYIFGRYSVFYVKEVWCATKAVGKGERDCLKNLAAPQTGCKHCFDSRIDAYKQCVVDFTKEHPDKIVVVSKKP